MNGKKIEEKGTQRANDNWYLPDEDELTLKIETIKRYAKDDYICGYTQAVADQQDTLTQYKEALEAAKTALNIIANSDPISIGLDEVDDMANKGLEAIEQLLNNE